MSAQCPLLRAKRACIHPDRKVPNDLHFGGPYEAAGSRVKREAAAAEQGISMIAGDFHRWMYRGGRPNRLAQIMNRASAIVFAGGIAHDYLVTLEVMGRRSGQRISCPLVMVIVGGQRYLISMLGEKAGWVRNVRAASGKAVLRHGRREDVQLEEITADERAPVLKAYLQRAPGARPHVAVDKDAPLSQFERIAATIPVFRVNAGRSG
jgi:deazaflavin-dependent oxidoreductase (nitroreductase family)